MLKLVSIWLSVILLAQGSSINTAELEKMDSLLEHAKFHKEKYGDNFAAFINKHYGNQKAKHSKEQQEEQQDHQQLPFQQTTPLLMQTAFLIELGFMVITSGPMTDLKNENYFYEKLHSSLLVREILQPPKFI
ncbi:MAG: hypothetical protein ACR2MM_12135 [Flavobacteriaceae bacterium]